jgi:hypothetical protein
LSLPKTLAGVSVLLLIAINFSRRSSFRPEYVELLRGKGIEGLLAWPRLQRN